MKQKKHQKLCHSCEGEVDLDVIFCPFCGADLLEERVEEPVTEQEEHFVPPYQPKTFLDEAVEEQRSHEEGKKEQILPSVILLSLGVWLFLFGFFLFIFGQEGKLTLNWSSRFWLLYITLSFPSLFFGYRFLKKLT